MGEWAHAFDCPVYCTPTTASGSCGPTPAIELWEGETLDLGDGLTLIRCGGHFAGGDRAALARREGGCCSGDTSR